MFFHSIQSFLEVILWENKIFLTVLHIHYSIHNSPSGKNLAFASLFPIPIYKAVVSKSVPFVVQIATLSVGIAADILIHLGLVRENIGTFPQPAAFQSPFHHNVSSTYVSHL